MAKILMKYRPCVKKTLISMEIGEEIEINVRRIKAASIRSAVRFLKKEGYEFTATERGLIDSVKVKRIK